MAREEGQPDAQDLKKQSGGRKKANGLGFYIFAGLIAALGATVAWGFGYELKQQRHTICYQAMQDPVHSDQPNYEENLIEVQRSCYGEIVDASKPGIQYFQVAKNPPSEPGPLAKSRQNRIFEYGALAALFSAPLLAWLIGFGDKVSGHWRRLGQYGAWTIVSMELWHLLSETLFPEFLGDSHAYTKLAQEHVLIPGLIVALLPVFLSVRKSNKPQVPQEPTLPITDLPRLTARARVRRDILAGRSKDAFAYALSLPVGIEHDNCCADVVRDDIQYGRKIGAQQRVAWIEEPLLRSALDATITQMTQKFYDIPVYSTLPSWGNLVVVASNFYIDSEKAGTVIAGFSSAETAREYAMRRIRHSVEKLRLAGDDAQTTRRKWEALGTDIVFENERLGHPMIEDFIATQFSDPEEVDYQLLAPKGTKNDGLEQLAHQDMPISAMIFITIFGILADIFLKPMLRALGRSMPDFSLSRHITLVDNLYRDDPRNRYIKSGFWSEKGAEVLATEIVTASIESFRHKGIKTEELYRLWMAEGIDVITKKLPDDQKGVGVGEDLFATKYNFKPKM